MSESIDTKPPTLSKKYSQERPSVNASDLILFDPTEDDDFKHGAIDFESKEGDEVNLNDLNQGFELLQRLNSTLDETEQKSTSISSLINFKRCTVGLCRSGDQEFDDTVDTTASCSECAKTIAEYAEDLNLMRCIGCHKRETPNPYICGECRMVWLEHWQNVYKLNDTKRRIIRRQLKFQPDLSLDLLCGLPTKPGLEKVIEDIEMMGGKNRNKYVLLLIDLDNLKAINSSLGHHTADEIIKDVGLILNSYAELINAGNNRLAMQLGPTAEQFLDSYVFRQGGDEFAMIIHCQNDAKSTEFMGFYERLRDDINKLATTYKMDEDQMAKGINAIKERKKAALRTAVSGLAKRMYQKKGVRIEDIEQVIDEQEIVFSMDKVGVSMGLFVPNEDDNSVINWIQNAEKAREAAKAIKGKNNIAIYYGDQQVLPHHKTAKCLEVGVELSLTMDL